MVSFAERQLQRKRQIALKEPICGFLDIVAHNMLGLQRGIRHPFDKDAVIALDPDVFLKLDAKGLLEDYYASMPSAAFFMADEELIELSDAEEEFRMIGSVALIWIAAACASPDCSGISEALNGGYVFSQCKYIVKSDADTVVCADDIRELKHVIGADIMLEAWHSGVPLEHVIG